MDLVAGRSIAAERRPTRHVDWILIAIVIALIVAGMFLLYSATNQTLRQDGFDPFERVKRQLLVVAAGAVLMIFAASFDYRFFKVYAGFFYAGGLLFVALLLIPGVASETGAFIDLPGARLLQLSPGEFVKLSVIIMGAAMLSEVRGIPDLRDVLRVVGIGALALLLLLANVEIGSAIVVVAIIVGLLVVAGARVKHLVALAVGAILLMALAFQANVIRDYQLDRIRAFLDREHVAEDVRYNLDQSLTAVGAGGLFGRGYLEGTQTNLDYVPEQHTDFIFTVVGEEFGFVGALVVLLLFALLLYRAIRIAYLSKDPFGTLVAAGIASMFAIQMFVNVGMVIGIMPITGIPLPFLSYGGSAMLTNLIAIGMLESIHMRRFI
ncbi:MAG TPA: FtsW/RodA/SpoVE family cell cycle protein [Actinomycetota bacterium]|nr:FtsW/RodA/SpoVE family cell cycle protein [Actinomycetota bacterium]